MQTPSAINPATEISLGEHPWLLEKIRLVQSHENNPKSSNNVLRLVLFSVLFNFWKIVPLSQISMKDDSILSFNYFVMLYSFNLFSLSCHFTTLLIIHTSFINYHQQKFKPPTVVLNMSMRFQSPL